MKQKIASILLTVLMIISMVPLWAIPAFAEVPVHGHSYAWNGEAGANGVHILICSNADGLCEEVNKAEACIYESGLCMVCGAEGDDDLGLLGASGTKTVKVRYYNTTYNEFLSYDQVCQILTSNNDDWKGWLVASGDITISGRVVVNEDVHLVLEDGCTLTCEKGIEVEKSVLPWKDNAHLYIYAQSEDSSPNKGKLITTGDGDRAGIGSGLCINSMTGDICGKITIHGGEIHATGGEAAAGIGGGNDANGASVTVYGGEIHAQGGKNGAGIGGGHEFELGTGGEGGTLTVYGGTVEATGGQYGAGIGGGQWGDGGSVTICGGTVTSTGGEYGAGIGGGQRGTGGSVTVKGGTVKSTGDEGGAGIGGGLGGDGGSVEIFDGTVVARGKGGGAGIGGGGKIIDGNTGNGGSLKVWGGRVDASVDSTGAAGIGGGFAGNGGSVELYGGSFYVSGAYDASAIGKGSDGNSNGTVTVGTGLAVFDTSSGRVNSGFDYRPWGEAYFFRPGILSFSVAPCIDPINYLRYDPIYGEWEASCQNYTFINKDIRNWKNGWYVVSDSGTFNDPVTVSGEVHLILQDEQAFNALGGIILEENASLDIYAQSDVKSTMGRLTAYGQRNAAGIGGRDGKSGGVITIHGGDIAVTGGSNAAGIGGGRNGGGGTIKLYGGKLTATAGTGAQRAIGAGLNSTNPGQIIVRGGYDLYDDVTDTTLVREEGSSTQWTDLVNRKYHILTLTPSSSYLTDPVPYHFYDGQLKLQSSECRLYRLVKPDTEAMEGGWYVVKGNIKIDHPLSALGDVHLILTDGCELTVNGGLCVNMGHSVTIHAQSEDESTMGTLTATGSGSAGIGANNEFTSGDITIDGGNITAIGSGYSAGIGGSYFSPCGNIAIRGGIVNAKSTSSGAGIGGGYYEASFDVEHDEWEETDVFDFFDYGHNGTIGITGGIVNAEGNGGGAGIGGGEGYDAGKIIISGGTVTAKGGANGAGIGSGHASYWNDWDWESYAPVPGGEVSVTKGDVTAIGGDDRTAFLCDTLNIKETLSVYVNDSAVPVKNASDYASSCQNAAKAHILANEHTILAYIIIAGAGGEWTKGETLGLLITSDAPFAKFDSVKVDGAAIAANNYTAEEGSTRITLAPAYLETLSIGGHTIEIVSCDGSASTGFTVKAAAQPSKYNVTFNMGGHGTAPADQTVIEGGKAIKPAIDPSAEGWTFDGWYANAAFSAKFNFGTAITRNTTVYAKWTKNSASPTDPVGPQTGDNQPVILWIALLFVSASALFGAIVYGKRKN